MSTLPVVEQVMRETKTPMAVRDIVELAGDSLPSRSKTPDTVVARDLSMNIKRLGAESRFIRTAPGRYTMREFVESGLIQMGDSGSTPQPTRQQAMPKQPTLQQPSTVGVLSTALASERRGLLPSSSSVTSSAVTTPVPEVSPLDDVNSL
jgi:hypothetical protein